MNIDIDLDLNLNLDLDNYEVAWEKSVGPKTCHNGNNSSYTLASNLIDIWNII
jgi:hypothetical protein